MIDFSQLRQLGWKAVFDRQLTPQEFDQISSGTLVVARVSGHHRTQLDLMTADDELSIPLQLLPDGDDVTVGDWLLLDAGDHRAVRRLDRSTMLVRKAAGETVKPQLMAANVDTLLVVTSCNQDFNLSRLERYLALALEADAQPVVVLTKADLFDDPDTLRRQVERLQPGILVEAIDARDADQAAVLAPFCRAGETVALLGSSGVGKSTLATALGAGPLATAEIRADDDKGRHTTTARSLHRLAAGGILVDTPGMRELQLSACEDGVSELFDDVLAVAARCRFRDCTHQGDTGCAVQAAVESGDLEPRRLRSYLKLQSEQARNAETLAARRDRERKTGRYYKSVMAEKRHRRGE